MDPPIMPTTFNDDDGPYYNQEYGIPVNINIETDPHSFCHFNPLICLPDELYTRWTGRFIRRIDVYDFVDLSQPSPTIHSPLLLHILHAMDNGVNILQPNQSDLNLTPLHYLIENIIKTSFLFYSTTYLSFHDTPSVQQYLYPCLLPSMVSAGELSNFLIILKYQYHVNYKTIITQFDHNNLLHFIFLLLLLLDTHNVNLSPVWIDQQQRYCEETFLEHVTTACQSSSILDILRSLPTGLPFTSLPHAFIPPDLFDEISSSSRTPSPFIQILCDLSIQLCDLSNGSLLFQENRMNLLPIAILAQIPFLDRYYCLFQAIYSLYSTMMAVDPPVGHDTSTTTTHPKPTSVVPIINITNSTSINSTPSTSISINNNTSSTNSHGDLTTHKLKLRRASYGVLKSPHTPHASSKQSTSTNQNKSISQNDTTNDELPVSSPSNTAPHSSSGVQSNPMITLSHQQQASMDDTDSTNKPYLTSPSPLPDSTSTQPQPQSQSQSQSQSQQPKRHITSSTILQPHDHMLDQDLTSNFDDPPPLRPSIATIPPYDTSRSHKTRYLYYFRQLTFLLLQYQGNINCILYLYDVGFTFPLYGAPFILLNYFLSHIYHDNMQIYAQNEHIGQSTSHGDPPIMMKDAKSQSCDDTILYYFDQIMLRLSESPLMSYRDKDGNTLLHHFCSHPAINYNNTHPSCLPIPTEETASWEEHQCTVQHHAIFETMLDKLLDTYQLDPIAKNHYGVVPLMYLVCRPFTTQLCVILIKWMHQHVQHCHYPHGLFYPLHFYETIGQGKASLALGNKIRPASSASSSTSSSIPTPAPSISPLIASGYDDDPTSTTSLHGMYDDFPEYQPFTSSFPWNTNPSPSTMLQMYAKQIYEKYCCCTPLTMVMDHERNTIFHWLFLYKLVYSFSSSTRQYDQLHSQFQYLQQHKQYQQYQQQQLYLYFRHYGYHRLSCVQPQYQRQSQQSQQHHPYPPSVSTNPPRIPPIFSSKQPFQSFHLSPCSIPLYSNLYNSADLCDEVGSPKIAVNVLKCFNHTRYTEPRLFGYGIGSSHYFYYHAQHYPIHHLHSQNDRNEIWHHNNPHHRTSTSPPITARNLGGRSPDHILSYINTLMHSSVNYALNSCCDCISGDCVFPRFTSASPEASHEASSFQCRSYITESYSMLFTKDLLSTSGLTMSNHAMYTQLSSDAMYNHFTNSFFYCVGPPAYFMADMIQVPVPTLTSHDEHVQDQQLPHSASCKHLGSSFPHMQSVFYPKHLRIGYLYHHTTTTDLNTYLLIESIFSGLDFQKNNMILSVEYANSNFYRQYCREESIHQLTSLKHGYGHHTEVNGEYTFLSSGDTSYESKDNDDDDDCKIGHSYDHHPANGHITSMSHQLQHQIPLSRQFAILLRQQPPTFAKTILVKDPLTTTDNSILYHHDNDSMLPQTKHPTSYETILPLSLHLPLDSHTSLTTKDTLETDSARVMVSPFANNRWKTIYYQKNNSGNTPFHLFCSRPHPYLPPTLLIRSDLYIIAQLAQPKGFSWRYPHTHYFHPHTTRTMNAFTYSPIGLELQKLTYRDIASEKQQFCAYRNNFALMVQLLHHHSPINQTNNNGCSPLMLLCSQQHHISSLVLLMRQYSVDLLMVNVKHYKRTIFHHMFCTTYNTANIIHYPCYRLLSILLYSQLNQQNSNGYTPLDYLLNLQVLPNISSHAHSTNYIPFSHGRFCGTPYYPNYTDVDTPDGSPITSPLPHLLTTIDGLSTSHPFVFPSSPPSALSPLSSPPLSPISTLSPFQFDRLPPPVGSQPILHSPVIPYSPRLSSPPPPRVVTRNTSLFLDDLVLNDDYFQIVLDLVKKGGSINILNRPYFNLLYTISKTHLPLTQMLINYWFLNSHPSSSGQPHPPPPPPSTSTQPQQPPPPPPPPPNIPPFISSQIQTAAVVTRPPSILNRAPAINSGIAFRRVIPTHSLLLPRPPSSSSSAASASSFRSTPTSTDSHTTSPMGMTNLYPQHPQQSPSQQQSTSEQSPPARMNGIRHHSECPQTPTLKTAAQRLGLSLMNGSQSMMSRNPRYQIIRPYNIPSADCTSRIYLQSLYYQSTLHLWCKKWTIRHAENLPQPLSTPPSVFHLMSQSQKTHFAVCSTTHPHATQMAVQFVDSIHALVEYPSAVPGVFPATGSVASTTTTTTTTTTTATTTSTTSSTSTTTASSQTPSTSLSVYIPTIRTTMIDRELMWLLKSDARLDINVREYHGKTPLHLLVEYYFRHHTKVAEVIDILLNYQNLQYQQQDDINKHTMSILSSGGQPDDILFCIRLFLIYGADTDPQLACLVNECVERIVNHQEAYNLVPFELLKSSDYNKTADGGHDDHNGDSAHLRFFPDHQKTTTPSTNTSTTTTESTITSSDLQNTHLQPSQLCIDAQPDRVHQGSPDFDSTYRQGYRYHYLCYKAKELVSLLYIYFLASQTDSQLVKL